MSLLIEAPEAVHFITHGKTDAVSAELHLGSPDDESSAESYRQTLREENRVSVFNPEIEPAAVRRPAKNKSRRRKAATPSGSVEPTSTLTFAKVPVSPVLPESKTTSELSRCFGRANAPTFNVEIPAGPAVDLKVFVSFHREQAPLTVTISQNATADHLIMWVLHQYAMEERSPPLKNDSNAYILRLTEGDDGTPDEDLPALDRAQVLHRVRVDDFALCINPKANPHEADQGPTATSTEDAQDKRQSAIGNLFLKVHLPNGGSTTVTISPDILIKDLLKIISQRRSLPVDHLTVSLMDPPIPVDINRTLRSLNCDELVLSRKRRDHASMSTIERARSGSTSQAPAEPQDLILFSNFTAIKYEQFNVIKINKAGRRQKRIMGIDDEKIHNMIPEEKSSKRSLFGRKKEKQVKRKFRMLDEVKEIVYDGGNSTEFSIAFTDGQRVDYEAESHGEAARICAKIRYLLNMKY